MAGYVSVLFVADVFSPHAAGSQAAAVSGGGSLG